MRHTSSLARPLLLASATLFALLSLAACSGDQSEGSTPATAAGGNIPAGSSAELSPVTSGTRLRARFITTPDGAKQYVGWFDNARNENCTFQVSGDQSVRCIPETVPNAYQSGQFGDKDCKQPIYVPQQPFGQPPTASCASTAKYVMDQVQNYGSCYNGQLPVGRIYEATPQDPSAAVYYNNGSCQANPSPGAATVTGFVGTKLVDWNEFVQATSTSEIKDGLKITSYTTPDGAKAIAGYALADDTPCTLQTMNDGQLRCLPQTYGTQVFFADSSCSTPAYAYGNGGGGGCGSSSYWIDDVSGTGASTCPGAARAVYTFGNGSVDSSTLYLLQQQYNGTTSQYSLVCQSASGYYGNSNLVPLIDVTNKMPAVTRSGGGGGRLVPTFVSMQGTRQATPGWHDTQLDVDCVFTTASDGKLRCLPNAATADLGYDDEACKGNPLVVLGAPTCNGAGAYALQTSLSCPTTTTVFSIAKETKTIATGSVALSGGACAKAGGLIGAHAATPADPGQFVEATIVNE